MRVLLVEDDPMIGESLVEGLRGECYAVDWVRDGHDAELALAGFAYDLMLLDLGLPGKEGMDVLRAPRARRHAGPRRGARQRRRRLPGETLRPR